jgi:tetratricopeptide (TPR) repeat protein
MSAFPSSTSTPSSPPIAPSAWNAFVQQHGALILETVMDWCEADCRVSRSAFACVLRVIASAAPERAEAPDHCDEALAAFTWACKRLRERLPSRRGVASESGWLRVQLLDLRALYLGVERGRLTLPAALAGASADAQAVFRLSCRQAARDHVGRVLGLGDAALAAAEGEVRACLTRAGLAWWPWRDGAVEAGWLPLEPLCDRGEEAAALAEGGLAPDVEAEVRGHVDACEACRDRRAAVEAQRAANPASRPVPPWVLRPVIDRTASDAPEPEVAHSGLRARLMAQPDWLAGLVVGGVLCVFLLLVVLPRQEYAKPVIAPEDEVLAVAATPLSEPLARRLTEARRQLRRGQIEAAVQNLNAVLARRPDEQEARWLLASTYDRLGDASRAAKHYRAYLHVHDRREEIEDSRARRIRKRLGQWEDESP